MLKAFVFGVMVCGTAAAETVDVPLLPDGSVDFNAVMSGFRVTSPLTNGGPEPRFLGSFLGTGFNAEWEDVPAPAPFDLFIASDGLSEHATYIVAVLVNDLICLRSERRAGSFRWKTAAVPIEGGWRLRTSCLDEPSGSPEGGGS